MSVLKIGGVDISPYIEEGGLSWKLNDLEAPGAGRTTMDGIMHRARIASKVSIEVSCKPLNSAEASIVLSAINPEFVTVELDDPLAGGKKTRTMYSNNKEISLKSVSKDGTNFWTGLRFPLIER